jgi:hypothetical protein
MMIVGYRFSRPWKPHISLRTKNVYDIKLQNFITGSP